MLVTKIDICIACERKKTTAPVRITATKPRLSGSSAAATEPNTASRTMNTIGKPAASAFSRSVFETSCRPLQNACWPTRWIGTVPSLDTPASLRIFTAASTLWSVSPVTLRAIRTIGELEALAAATACGDTDTPSTPRTAPAALSMEARSAAASWRRLSNTKISGSVCTPGNRLRSCETASDWDPGTSKPPAVRCLVCCAANGSDARRRTIQTPRTRRRRRETKPPSRSMAACMRAL